MFFIHASYSTPLPSDATTFTLYDSGASCSTNGFRVTSPSSEQYPNYMVAVDDTLAADTGAIYYVLGHSVKESRLPSCAWFALNCQGFLVTGQGGVFGLLLNAQDYPPGNALMAGNPAVMNGSIQTNPDFFANIVVRRRRFPFLDPFKEIKNTPSLHLRPHKSLAIDLSRCNRSLELVIHT
jgi:endoglucanase Acf2